MKCLKTKLYLISYLVNWTFVFYPTGVQSIFLRLKVYVYTIGYHFFVSQLWGALKRNSLHLTSPACETIAKNSRGKSGQIFVNLWNPQDFLTILGDIIKFLKSVDKQAPFNYSHCRNLQILFTVIALWSQLMKRSDNTTWAWCVRRIFVEQSY